MRAKVVCREAMISAQVLRLVSTVVEVTIILEHVHGNWADKFWVVSV